jgi:hypothetical protein
MADFKRLGKRGAYRFGDLRQHGPSPRPAPAPHQPSFGTRRSRAGLVRWLCSCAAAAALLGLGAWLGLWWLPFVAGVAAGLARWRVRSALGWVVLAVLAGWGVTLWVPAWSGAPADATARVVAALAGLPPFAAVGVAGTLLVGVLQGVVAVWLTRALRPRSPASTHDQGPRPVKIVRRLVLLSGPVAGSSYVGIAGYFLRPVTAGRPP